MVKKTKLDPGEGTLPAYIRNIYVHTGMKMKFPKVKNTPSEGGQFVKRKKSRKGGVSGELMRH